MASSSQQNALSEPWLMENGSARRLSKDSRHKHGRSAHSMSSSSLRKKSDRSLINRVQISLLRQFLANLQEVLVGTKLFILFPVVPLAVAAHYYNFGRVSEITVPLKCLYLNFCWRSEIAANISIMYYLNM